MAHDLLLELPESTPVHLKSLRTKAGLTQRQAAELAGLGDHMRWSEFERSVRKISPVHWAIFLLATDQHPSKRIAIRRQAAAASASSRAE